MKRIFSFFFFFFLFFSLAFSQFTSFTQFRDSLYAISAVPEAALRDSLLTNFWNSLKAERQIPFTFGDSVAFLYRGNAYSVRWVGDFNGWGQENTGYGQLVSNTDLWIWETTFPSDARLDYKIILNGTNWILDPSNPYQQWGGFGPNSELRMPDYVEPVEIIRDPDAPRGTLTNWQYLKSQYLKYTVKYKIYTPAGYDTLSALPVIYVTDGDEYMDDRMGSMIIILDNLIHWKVIQPVMAVFISAWDSLNQTNRRMSEYNVNPNYVNFVTRELIPVIDSTYRSDPSPDARAILGTSMGGLNSAYFGQAASEYFHRIAIQSPAFWYNTSIFDMYSNSSVKPVSIYMSTGTIHDTRDDAQQMKSILLSKGYNLKYTEVNQSHSWGNWRGLIDEALIFFWQNPTNPIQENDAREINGYRLLGHFPNPFNSSIMIKYQIPELSFVHFSLYDILGRKIYSRFLGKLPAGKHKIIITNDIFHRLPSGVYFYELRFNRSLPLVDKIIYVK
jgi:enterochelin esterase family protein